MSGHTGSEPRFDDLPVMADLGIQHSWNVLAPNLGTLERLSPENVLAAVSSVRRGETIGLNYPVDAFDPPLFGRVPGSHEVMPMTLNDFEDVVSFNPQASSQLDGLAHVRAREYGFYGGIQDFDEARAALGVHHYSHAGVVGRGVLVDIQRLRRSAGVDADPGAGVAIGAEEIQAALSAKGVSLRRGDILLVRTGWAHTYLESDDPDQIESLRGRWTGVSAAESTARFLWDSGVALIGCDNPSVEDSPGAVSRGSLHRRLLPGLGMPMMEMLNLERLAARCEDTGTWEFLFVAVPLAVVGGVASPSNAVAIL